MAKVSHLNPILTSLLKTNGRPEIKEETEQNRKLFSQLDDFDQDIIIGNAVSSGQKIAVVSNSPVDREFSVNNSDGISTNNKITVIFQILERCFNEWTDRKKCNIVDTVQDRIQNAILTTNNNTVTPRIELVVRLINASSGRDAASVTEILELGERIGITASFENVSERNITFHELSRNDLDEASELSVPRTNFDRQSHTHHNTAL